MTIKKFLYPLLIFITCFVILILLLLVLLDFISPTPPTLNQMTEYFNADREKIQIIIDYFIENDFDWISIGRNDVRNIGSTSFGILNGIEIGNIVVENEEVVKSILFLFQQGYQRLDKSRGTIRFQRWSTLDAGSGMVYSINGTTPNENIFPFLIKLEPLNENRWYFYIDDFNEWRIRNRN